MAPKETEVSVEPTYVLAIDANRVRLDAHLKYKIRGTGVYTVNVRLPGWRVSEVTPANLVDSPNLDLEKLEPLAIPLAPAAWAEPTNSDCGSRPNRRSPTPPNPSWWCCRGPRRSSVAPATVVVLPADNVELTVAESETQGLDRESTVPPIELPPRQQPPLLFRERGDAKTAVLGRPAADAHAVGVGQPGHHAAVEATRQRVEQQFAYRIAYEPLKMLGLDVPRAVLEAGKLRHPARRPAAAVRRGAGGRGAGAARTPPAANAAEPPLRIQVDLLAEQIGTYDLLLTMKSPPPALPANKETPRSVAGVWPAADGPLVLTGNTLRVYPGESLQVRVKPAAGSRSTPVRGRRFCQRRLAVPGPGVDAPAAVAGAGHGSPGRRHDRRAASLAADVPGPAPAATGRSSA